MRDLLAIVRLIGPKLPLWMPVFLAIKRAATFAELLPLILTAIEGTFTGPTFGKLAPDAATNHDMLVAECMACGCDKTDIDKVLDNLAA